MANNMFDKLDEISEQQRAADERSRREHEQIMQALNRRRSEVDPYSGVRAAVDKRNEDFSIQNFTKRANQEYIWVGPSDEFQKEKKTALILILSSILSMVLCTIVSTLSFGIYSSYTLFENIWLFLMLFVLVYTLKTKKSYPALDFILYSFFKLEPDAEGVIRNTGCKKKYKWFFILACIAFLLNILSVWVVDYSTNQILVTILELVALILNGITVYKVIEFFSGYYAIRFSGFNDRGTAKVVLIYDTVYNILYTEDEYLKIFPFLK